MLRLCILCFGAVLFSVSSYAQTSSIHLTASSPWQAYADPLGLESGVPLMSSIFDSLTLVEADGTVVPALAESWSNDSGTVWTFKLRPDVVFSDGSPLNADAVVDSLNLQIGTKGLALSTALYTRGISGVRAPSNDTIEIVTEQKDARLARSLANVNIFSAEAFRRLGRTEFSKRPVGTGPFTPDSWSSDGTRVVLKSVPTSWRPSIHVDRVEIAVVADSTARLQNILSGGTDISSNIDPDLISTIEAAGYQISIRPGPIVLTLALRTNGDAAEALRDRRVRVALNLAVNRENISKYLLNGAMEPATQLATPETVGYDPTIEPYTYDPDRARVLLDEAGYSDGFDFKGLVMTGQFPGDALIYQQVIQDLKAIGVRAEISSLPPIEFIRRRNANSWDGTDAIATFESHYRLGDISRAAEYYLCDDPRTTFCDSTLDELLYETYQEMDPITREQRLKAYNAHFQYLAPVIFITRYSAIDALSKRIKTFPMFPTGKMRFEQIELVED